MTATSHNNTDVKALRDDIDALKQDVQDLLHHLKSAAQSTGASASAKITDQVDAADAQLRAQATASMAQVERTVSENPLLALLIATGVGYIGGRLLSR